MEVVTEIALNGTAQEVGHPLVLATVVHDHDRVVQAERISQRDLELAGAPRMVNADLDDAALFRFRQEPGHRGACDAECFADLLLVEPPVIVQIRDKRNPRQPNIVVRQPGSV